MRRLGSLSGQLRCSRPYQMCQLSDSGSHGGLGDLPGRELSAKKAAGARVSLTQLHRPFDRLTMV
jgi:hypothetical protein